MENLIPKIEKLKFLINSNNGLFKCPFCENCLHINNNNSLVCQNRHTFDLSKNGTVLLMKKYEAKHDRIYTKELFENRRNFILNNYYSSVYREITNAVHTQFKNKGLNVLDLGCGECTHTHKIFQGSNNFVYGADISYDGIRLATDYLQNDILPICCDAFNLPFANNVFHVIINFLSPFYSSEVIRTLKKDGVFIKVVPTANYLIELRENFNIKPYEKEEEIKLNLEKNFTIVNEIEVNNVVNLTSKSKENLCKMTPMLNHINTHSKTGFNTASIALKIYVMKVKPI